MYCQGSESTAFTGAPWFQPGWPQTGLTCLQLLQRLAGNRAMQSPRPKSHCWCDSKPAGKLKKLPSSMTSQGLRGLPRKGLEEKGQTLSGRGWILYSHPATHSTRFSSLGPISLCVCVLVWQLCPTLCDSMDCSPTGSSVHGILQARILEWVAISYSRGSSWPKDQTWVS